MRDLTRRFWAAVFFFRQKTAYEIVERGGHVEEELRKARRRRRHQARERRDRRRPDVRRTTRDELEERGAERVDVAPHVGAAVPARLLGRHVRRRPDDGAGSGEANIVGGGDAE